MTPSKTGAPHGDDVSSWRRRPDTVPPSSYFPRQGTARSAAEGGSASTLVSYRMRPDELAALAEVGRRFNLNLSESMRLVLAFGLDAVRREADDFSRALGGQVAMAVRSPSEALDLYHRRRAVATPAATSRRRTP